MQFAFNVGDAENSRVEFHRDPWIGKMTIKVDGHEVVSKRAELFSLDCLKIYRFVVVDRERHNIAIEHERSRCFAGCRKQKYRAFVDGQLIEEHYGF